MKQFKIIISFAFMLALLLTAPLSEAAEIATHRVQEGETLWEISRSYDIPMEVIINNNDLTSSRQLRAGQELIITATGNQIIISIEDINSPETEYTVNWGDSLYLIAQKFDVSVNDIMNRNNLDNTELSYGQKLIIPGTNNTDQEPTDGPQYHTVESGDSLWTIAQKYDLSIQKLIEINELGDDFGLYPGQELLVEVSEDDEQPEKSPEEELSDIEPYYFYEVQEGDRIWTIARDFGLTVSELLNYNHLSRSDDIETGQLLVVPLNRTSDYSYLRRAAQRLNNHYRVQSGETLEEIAAYFEIPAEGLRILNQLDKEDSIRNNQLLKMPVNPGLFKQHELYRVNSEEEYLFDIAYQKGVSIRSILKANNLSDPNTTFTRGTTVLITLDEDSQATWIDYEDGKPVDSFFSN